MTDLRINQLIAEHCGWKFITFDIGWHVVGDFEVKAKIPDYCNDLNIMRKAELSLWHDECLVEQYEENLKKEFLYQVGYQGAAYWFMANAHTKAVAFLKTIGKM